MGHSEDYHHQTAVRQFSRHRREAALTNRPFYCCSLASLLACYTEAFAVALTAASLSADEVEDHPVDHHWAFQPILRPPAPRITNSAWPRNDIDRFVLAKLEEQHIEPSPEAPPEILIRRLYLDLIGMPPTWRRVTEFIEDPRPDAYERLVDELLVSPHYGERWARHWLDLARYADSTGYEADTPRQIWAYRDWVIAAFNADMPFDQFVTEQLAGDLLPNATVGQRIATGFHCNAMFDPGVRHESIIDQVNTTGAVFLGLTTGCAQCHAHKTDSLTQREFYQLYAFFNEATITEMKVDTEFYVPPPVDKDSAETLKPLTTLIMNRTPQPTHVFVGGEPGNPGELVQAGLPAFLNSGSLNPAEPHQLSRLDLARWLTSADNPLTARVTVNRDWQRFWGTGLVPSENDFGMQTAAPVHRELLDYLTMELRGRVDEFGESERWAGPQPWRGFKSLHRLMVTSATYRQSSNNRLDLADLDPGNRLLARQRRLRLEAEFIPDVTLASSGLLGGPSVFPHQVDGILDYRATPAKWTISDGEDVYRRGMYTWVWRLTPYPSLPLFDAPDAVTTCTRRSRSNVPVQALTLLNGPIFVGAARAMAARIVTVDAKSDTDRFNTLIRTCLSRDPSTTELTLLKTLISDQRRTLAANRDQAKQICKDSAPSNCDAVEFATCVVASRVVMNLDEFITRE
jgi:hypothetical protein